jgi:chemotaxis signal transduction protein
VIDRAAELRDAFDRGFSAAERAPEPGRHDFLCVRVAGEPFAIPLGDVASLHADLRIIALPARAPELVGVAAIRAVVVPVYDLALALGLAASAAPGAIRWTVLVRGGPAGFAFEGYDGHARIPDREVPLAPRPGLARSQVSIAGQPRLVIELAAVMSAISARWRRAGAAKEP